MMTSKSITAFWWNQKPNFGDSLNYDLLSSYGFDVTFKGLRLNPDILSIGSILQMTPENYSGVILGSGIIKSEKRVFHNADVRGVRGELTRQCLQLERGVILGDPGLLAHRVVSPQGIDKKHAVGLVVHWQETGNEIVQALAQKYGDDLLVISTSRSAPEVLADIAQCAYILSSSLHGLIVADSYGIPCGWVLLSGYVGGGEFKYRDYGSSIRTYFTPLKLRADSSLSELILHARSTPSTIAEVKENLELAFYRYHLES